MWKVWTWPTPQYPYIGIILGTANYIIPKPEWIKLLSGNSLTFHHHLRWPTSGLVSLWTNDTTPTPCTNVDQLLAWESERHEPYHWWMLRLAVFIPWFSRFYTSQLVSRISLIKRMCQLNQPTYVHISRKMITLHTVWSKKSKKPPEISVWYMSKLLTNEHFDTVNPATVIIWHVSKP